MFRKIEDFQKAWTYEAEMTGKVLNTLTDASLGQKVTPEGRDLGFLGWHLTLTLGEMLALVGLKIDAPAMEEECPTEASAIAAAYEKAAKSVADEIAANWNDETLLQEDEMYGETVVSRYDPLLPDRPSDTSPRPDHGFNASGLLYLFPASTAPPKKNGPLWELLLCRRVELSHLPVSAIDVASLLGVYFTAKFEKKMRTE